MLSSNASQQSTPILIPQRYGADSGQAGKQLTDQQIDLWEHTSLLYHAYEWQAAAEMFTVLASEIEMVEDRTFCLLNAAIIQARLGDYLPTVAALEEAAMLGQDYLITIFLMGLVSFELGDHGRAEACFEACLDGVTMGAIDHSDCGLEFVMNGPLLKRNLRAVRTATFSATYLKSTSGASMHLDALPAECIFEAPPRLTTPLSTGEPKRSWSTSIRRSLTGKMSKGRVSRVLAPSGASPSLPVIERPLTSPLSGYQQTLSSSSANSHAQSGHHASPTQRMVSPLETISRGNKHTTWHRRPSTPYKPRDAEGEYTSTRELARFIRLADKDQRQDLIPKDAKGERYPVEELSSFVRKYAPERLSAAIPERLSVRPSAIAELRTVQALHADDQQQHTPLRTPFSPSGLEEVARPAKPSLEKTPSMTRRSYVTMSQHAELEDDVDFETAGGSDISSQLFSGHEPERSTSPSMLEDHDSPLELLLPRAYAPEKSKRRSQQHDSDRSCRSPKKQSDEETPPTTGSTLDAFTRALPTPVRKEVARDDALKRLEGRESPKQVHVRTVVKTTTLEKPLPPDPGGGPVAQPRREVKTPDTVATVDFFDRVLGPGKKRGR